MGLEHWLGIPNPPGSIEQLHRRVQAGVTLARESVRSSPQVVQAFGPPGCGSTKLTDLIGRPELDGSLDFGQRLAMSASDEQGLCEAAPRVVRVIPMPAFVNASREPRVCVQSDITG